MNGYLSILADRLLGSRPTIEPRLRSTYEPATNAPGVGAAADLDPSLTVDAEIGALARAPHRPRSVHPRDQRPEPVALDGETDCIDSTLPPRPEYRPEPIEASQSPARKTADASGALPPLDDAATAEPTRSLAHPQEPDSAGQSPDETPRQLRVALPVSPEPTPPATRPRRVAPASIQSSNTVGHANAELVNHRAPVVKVTIGRVEVRANFSAPTSAARPPATPRAKLSLEDYLKSRNGGTR